MPGKVTAHMGDIFEGGADLTLLPCGAKPSWTSGVQRWIDQFGLPSPKDLVERLSLSEITPIVEFPASKQITKFVAYGASVLNDQTSANAIRKLGENIGRISRGRPDIRMIESVLFGTGHGRLDDAVAAEALSKGFRKTAAAAASLSIFVQGSARHGVISQAIAGKGKPIPPIEPLSPPTVDNASVAEKQGIFPIINQLVKRTHANWISIIVGVIAIIVGVVGIVAAIVVARDDGPTIVERRPEVSAPRKESARQIDPTLALATRFTGHEWSQEGESCDRDGIRFIIEGGQLVGYPRAATPIRYSLVRADGQRLITRLNGRLILLLFREDGFTHSDGEYNRWFRLCR